MRLFFVILGTTALLGNSCQKNSLPDYYFKCKIDGHEYIPNNRANCMRALVLNDTVFLMNANAGFETIAMGLYDGSKVAIKKYVLNGKTTGSAEYKYSTTTYDVYKTDSTHTGELAIIALDKASKTIQGNFYFNGYNAFKNDSVTISEGVFRLKYTDY